MPFQATQSLAEVNADTLPATPRILGRGVCAMFMLTNYHGVVIIFLQNHPHADETLTFLSWKLDPLLQCRCFFSQMLKEFSHCRGFSGNSIRIPHQRGWEGDYEPFVWDSSAIRPHGMILCTWSCLRGRSWQHPQVHWKVSELTLPYAHVHSHPCSFAETCSTYKELKEAGSPRSGGPMRLQLPPSSKISLIFHFPSKNLSHNLCSFFSLVLCPHIFFSITCYCVFRVHLDLSNFSLHTWIIFFMSFFSLSLQSALL